MEEINLSIDESYNTNYSQENWSSGSKLVGKKNL